MRRLALVAANLVLLFAPACGGGSTRSPSAPSTSPPTTPTPTTLTVYTSVEEPAMVSLEYAHWADFVDPFPPHKYLQAGWNYWTRIDPPHDRVWSGFEAAFKFDVTGVAGRTVTRATVRLYVYHANQDSKIAPPVKLNAFASNWDPNTISWNVLQGIPYRTSGEAQVASPTATGPLDWDVTTIVRNWASGAWNNYGFKLSVDRYPDPGYDSRASTAFCGTAAVGDILSPECQRPQLVIESQ